MPHFLDIADGLQPPRSTVRTTELIPEWIVGAIYKSGGFTFLLREMDTDGMTLEIIETDLKDSELLDPGPNDPSKSPLDKAAEAASLIKPQRTGKLPFDPSMIIPRP